MLSDATADDQPPKRLRPAGGEDVSAAMANSDSRASESQASVSADNGGAIDDDGSATEHVGSWETVALAARLIGQADAARGRAGAARAILADLIASALDRSPVERWYGTTAALLADLGPALFGTEDRSGPATWAAIVEGDGPDHQPMARVAAIVVGRSKGDAESANVRLLDLCDHVVDGLVLTPTTDALPWRRNLEGILANVASVADGRDIAACRCVLDDDAVARLRSATIDDALAVVDRLGTLADGTTELISARPRGVEQTADTAVTVLRRALDLDGIAIVKVDAGEAASTLARWGSGVPDGAVAMSMLPGAIAPRSDGQQYDIGDDLVSLSRPGIGSVLAAPLRATHSSAGVIWVVRRAPKRDFDRWERRLVAEAAETLSLVLTDNTHKHQLAMLAHTDALTGLGNRGSLDDRLRDLFAQPIVERTDSALVMCDVDGLKYVNDSRGHAAGDDLLCEVGDLLVELVAEYQGGTVYRLGGDEFCVLLPSGGLLGADLLASDLTHGADELGIGLSCGVAYGVRADSPRALLDAADEAQYAVKRRRRAMTPAPAESGPVSGRRARRDRD